MDDVAAQGPTRGFAKLVPEFDVLDLTANLRFWCDGLGFAIAYRRSESAFAYLEREGAQVMPCQMDDNWQTAPHHAPSP